MQHTALSNSFLSRLKIYFSNFKFSSKKSKTIYKLLIIQAIFEGLTQGVFYLQEAIARKTLFATDFEITLIGIFMYFALFFAFYFGYFSRGKKKFNYYIISLIFGRAIFFTSFLLKDIRIYMGYLFLYYLFSSIQSPGVNAIFQNTFDKKLFGKLFSIFRMLINFSSLCASLLFGKLLDINNHYYIYLLMFGALTGSISFLLLAIIDKKVEYKKVKEKIKNPMVTLFNIFKNNRSFLSYEILFMIYGFGFMVMVPVSPIFLLGKLNFSYSQMALVRGVLTQVFIVLLLPLAGIIYDKISVWKIFSASQLFLMVYPLSFLVSSILFNKIDIHIIYRIIYLGYLFFGMGLTGITIVWNLASINFAKEDDVTLFQGVHVSLTGVRGLLGPLLSYLILKIFNFNAVFITAFLFFLLAFIGSSFFYKQNVKNIV